MEISACNQIKGTITDVTLRAGMAEITLDTGNGQQIASVIRKASIGDLASKPASRRSRHHQELQGHAGAVEHTVLRKFGRSGVP